MNQSNHSKSGLFLMEIMLNILFFSVLVTFCLQLFFKAYTISESTSVLHRAVSTCTSLAEIYQSDSNGKELLLHVYPDAIHLNNTILLYYDENFTNCSESEAAYRTLITFTDDELGTAKISFLQVNNSDIIYTLEVAGYKPGTPSSLSGGDLP